MTKLRTIVVLCCIAVTRADAQDMRVDVGSRVRLDVAKEIRRSPVSVPTTRTVGTISGISAETLYVLPASSTRDVAIPRILLHRVDGSLGPPSRWDSMKQLVYFGAVLGLLVPVEDGWLRARLMGAGATAGAIVGLVRPYERWEPAWIALTPRAR